MSSDVLINLFSSFSIGMIMMNTWIHLEYHNFRLFDNCHKLLLVQCASKHMVHNNSGAVRSGFHVDIQHMAK